MQIQLYAQRQLAAALTHETPSEMEFAQLATIKAVLLGQVRGGGLREVAPPPHTLGSACAA